MTHQQSTAFAFRSLRRFATLKIASRITEERCGRLPLRQIGLGEGTEVYRLALPCELMPIKRNSPREARGCLRRTDSFAAPPLPPLAQTIEVEVNDRRGVKRERLTEDQPARNGDAEWPPQFRAHPG